MFTLIVSSIFAIVIAGAALKASAWRRAYNTAKSTNFPVYLSPVHLRDMWWLIIHPMLVPVLELLPTKWTHPWFPLFRIFEVWKIGHKPFADIGSDTVLLATPNGNMLWTCDPLVCHQLESSYPKFQKAVEMLKFLDIYGPSLASVEGSTWRTHHKVIMSGFNPTTNATVWRETTDQTKALISQWSKQDNVIENMRQWTNRLTLHVLSAVFFRKTLIWDDASGGVNPTPPGHRISFEQALFTILARLGDLLVTPRFLLGILPFERVRETHVAFTEFTSYIKEMIEDTKLHLDDFAGKKFKSILESIVIAGTSSDVPGGNPLLPEASVLGNTFFILSAGHETTGNTLAFVLNLLAVYPEYQEKIQQDLDRQIVERPQDEWGVDREYQLLQNGWLGAVLKEVLRLYCVVQWLPRVTTADIDIVDADGVSHIIPTDTMVVLNFAAAFQNPSAWSQSKVSAARRADLHHSPAVDFDPSRWLDQSMTGTDSLGSKFQKHFPFGQGVHACPGRLVALTEMTAFVATLLLNHSLELVVDPATLRKCNGDENAAWDQTRDQALRILVDDVSTQQNIELRKALPIRLVKRVQN